MDEYLVTLSSFITTAQLTCIFLTRAMVKYNTRIKIWVVALTYIRDRPPLSFEEFILF